jgi:hypothetical protein
MLGALCLDRVALCACLAKFGQFEPQHIFSNKDTSYFIFVQEVPLLAAMAILVALKYMLQLEFKLF